MGAVERSRTASAAGRAVRQLDHRWRRDHQLRPASRPSMLGERRGGLGKLGV